MADKGTTEPQNLWEGSPNPDPWTAAAHNELKEEDGHWEYMVRKSQNEGKGTFGRRARARARLIVNTAPHSLTHSLAHSLTHSLTRRRRRVQQPGLQARERDDARAEEGRQSVLGLVQEGHALEGGTRGW